MKITKLLNSIKHSTEKESKILYLNNALNIFFCHTLLHVVILIYYLTCVIINTRFAEDFAA